MKDLKEEFKENIINFLETTKNMSNDEILKIIDELLKKETTLELELKEELRNITIKMIENRK
jgi:hypothetical protein